MGLRRNNDESLQSLFLLLPRDYVMMDDILCIQSDMAHQCKSVSLDNESGLASYSKVRWYLIVLLSVPVIFEGH
jgi:hypothetical protein